MANNKKQFISGAAKLCLVVMATLLIENMLFHKRNCIKNILPNEAKCPESLNLHVTFPPGQTPVYRWDGLGWKMEINFCKWADLPLCVMLKTNAGETPIFVHNPQKDNWLSKRLLNKQPWEAENINLVLDEMKADPSMGFLDIGSHIGLFTLHVAKSGRKVVAMEVLPDNLQRLCKSVERGGLTNNVKLILNPISDGHGILSFTNPQSCAFPNRKASPNASTSSSLCKESMSFQSTTLDDVLTFVTFKKAFIKMDVEGFELQVVRGGKKFFSEIDVRGILMEWFMHKNKEGEKFIEEMMKMNYVPFDSLSPKKQLKPEDIMKWPVDVLWRKIART